MFPTLSDEDLRSIIKLLARSVERYGTEEMIEEAWGRLKSKWEDSSHLVGFPLPPDTEPAPIFVPARTSETTAMNTDVSETGTCASPKTKDIELHGGASSDASLLTISNAARLIRQGDLSPVELVRAYLSRIERLEGSVHAWETIDGEQALNEARRAEDAIHAGAPLSSLHGIPFAAKDVFFTKGMRTTGGSQVYREFIPSYDATVVTRLRRAGAILLGKSTTTEFAFGDPPTTRNPWNLAHSPGGSSSGSAAAVSSRMIAFALGTQTAGSLTRPAAYCGVVTLKATYGRISRYGVFPVSWSLDHIGAMTRTAEDQALILRVLCGFDEADPSTLHLPPPELPTKSMPRLAEQRCNLTIGRPDRFFFEAVDPSVRDAYEKTLDELKALGMSIKEVRLPHVFETAQLAHRLIDEAEVASYHASTLREKANLLRPRARKRLLVGSLITAPVYLRAQQIRRLYIEEMRKVWTSVDLLATPPSPTQAPLGLHRTGDAIFNLPFSLAGFPTITFPVGFQESTGLPLGIQLVAPPLKEDVLLTVALTYQQETDWHTRVPPLP